MTWIRKYDTEGFLFDGDGFYVLSFGPREIQNLKMRLMRRSEDATFERSLRKIAD